MKKLILLVMCVNVLFGMDLNFKKTGLEEFKLYGMSEKIVYENKKQRDEKIAKLWEKFLSSNGFASSQSSDGKLYVIYNDYTKNSFNCYIGIKSKKVVPSLLSRTITKSNYQKAVLNYTTSMKMDDIWDEINEQKLSRDFKIDMEEYLMSDLAKSAYKINIYLSTK